MPANPYLPTSEIFLRSPYWVTVEDDNLDYVLCDIRIWTGALTDEPEAPSAKLRSTGLDGITSMDIAEFARDYVEVTFDGNADSNAVFISYELTIYLDTTTSEPSPESRVYLSGLDGYGTFQEGINFQWYKRVMLSDTEMSAYPETNMSIPVLQKNLTGYELKRYGAGYGGALTTFRTVTGITEAENTADLVRTISTSYQGEYADEISFQFNDTQDETVKVKYTDCTKHGLTKIFFVNRLGCMQEMHFNGRFDVSVTATSDMYKRNLLVNGDYSNTRHQKSVLNKNGKIIMTLNSGWKSENENDSIIELLMSEQVWVIVDSSQLGVGWIPKQSSTYTVPVIVDTEETMIKNRINDKLINYTFRFEAAHDWINSVR